MRLLRVRADRLTLMGYGDRRQGADGWQPLDASDSANTKGNESSLPTSLNSFLIATGAAAATGADVGFSAAQSLTTLLTTESLLFAAFNAGVVLAAPATRPKNIAPANAYRLALGCVGVLAAVALAAALAWWQVFGDHWTGASLRTLEALGIAIGIVVQPIVALVVARSNRPPVAVAK